MITTLMNQKRGLDRFSNTMHNHIGLCENLRYVTLLVRVTDCTSSAQWTCRKSGQKLMEKV